MANKLTCNIWSSLSALVYIGFVSSVRLYESESVAMSTYFFSFIKNVNSINELIINGLIYTYLLSRMLNQW